MAESMLGEVSKLCLTRTYTRLVEKLEIVQCSAQRGYHEISSFLIQ